MQKMRNLLRIVTMKRIEKLKRNSFKAKFYLNLKNNIPCYLARLYKIENVLIHFSLPR